MYDDYTVKAEVEAAQAMQVVAEAAWEFVEILGRVWEQVRVAVEEFVEAFREVLGRYFEEHRGFFTALLLWGWMSANRVAAARRRGWRAKASMGGYGYG